MSVKVYTYDNPKRWLDHPRYEEIKGAIHICATSNMADGIREAYRDEDDGAFMHVYTIRKFINSVQPEWSTSEVRLAQFLTMSRVLKHHDVPVAEGRIKESFLKNKKELFETIRFLTYSGISPADYAVALSSVQGVTVKERMLLDIWTELESVDGTYAQLRSGMESGWEASRINSSLDMESAGGPSSYSIVLHGFYFITPEQQRFLECLRNAGIDIIFFNLYDERFPDTFGFTRAFITERYGWSDEWEIVTTIGDKTREEGVRFLRAYEDERIPATATGRNIVGYESFFEFMNKVVVPSFPIGTVDRTKTKTQLIATNADMLNDILSQYYPEMVTGKRNLLQYPVGQFLSNIHRIRKADGFFLSEEILMATFTSGWLYNPNTKENARDYTGQLKKILPYFQGCETLNQWNERFDSLSKLYDEVFASYEKAGDSRVVKSMRSPFARISQFSLDRKELSALGFFIRQLDFISKELFRIEEEGETIGTHFGKVLEVVSAYDPRPHTILVEEEVHVLEMLNEKLRRIEDDTFFLYEDVGEAVNLYLSGKLEDGETSLVKPFVEVDGEAFKKDRRFYVTGLDERGLPLSEFSLPWPIQEGTYEKLSESHLVLELDTLRNKSIKQISRYLFYITLEFLDVEKTELSWMRSYLDKKDMEPALYVKQLELPVVEPSMTETAAGEESIRENPFDFTQDEQGFDTGSFAHLTAIDFLMEYKSCERRFQYGYLLSEYPTFDAEFIHQFQYTDLLRVAKRASSLSTPKIISQIGSLFPGWTDYRKKMIAEKFIQNRRFPAKELEDISGGTKINEARIDFQLPGWTVSDRTRLREVVGNSEHVLVEDIKRKLDDDVPFETSPGKHCRFCPYLDSCTDGQFSIDAEGGATR